jgi:hypothetical protein
MVLSGTRILGMEKLGILLFVVALIGVVFLVAKRKSAVRE